MGAEVCIIFSIRFCSSLLRLVAGRGLLGSVLLGCAAVQPPGLVVSLSSAAGQSHMCLILLGSGARFSLVDAGLRPLIANDRKAACAKTVASFRVKTVFEE
mgnify:CR=1 FL=1